MHPNFNAILYDFFIEGLDLDTIAAKHETSWREVTEIVSSEPAMQTMRSAIRAERLRDIAQNLASRRGAIRILEGLIHDRSLTAVSHEGRRRAADAILRGTTPRGRSAGSSRTAARAQPAPPSSPPPVSRPLSPSPETEKQTAPAHRESVREPAQSTRQSSRVSRAQHRSVTPTQSVPAHQPARSACGSKNSS